MQTLGLGFTWEQLSPGQRFRTLNRTLTETDLVMFTGVTGMLETIFIDRTFGNQLDFVVDGGLLMTDVSSVISLVGDVPDVLRAVLGDVSWCAK